MDQGIADIIKASINTWGNPRADAEARQFQFKMEQDRENAPIIRKTNQLNLDAAEKAAKDRDEKKKTETELGKLVSGWTDQPDWDVPEDEYGLPDFENASQTTDAVEHGPLFLYDKDGGVHMTDEGRARIPQYISLMHRLHGHQGLKDAYAFMDQAGIPLEGNSTLNRNAGRVGRQGGYLAGLGSAQSNPLVGMTENNRSNLFDSAHTNSKLQSIFGVTPKLEAGQNFGQLSPTSLSFGGIDPKKLEEIKDALKMDFTGAKPNGPDLSKSLKLDASGAIMLSDGQRGDVGMAGQAGPVGSEPPAPSGSPSSAPTEGEEGDPTYNQIPNPTRVVGELEAAAIKQQLRTPQPPVLKRDPNTGRVTVESQDPKGVDPNLTTVAEDIRRKYARAFAEDRLKKVSEANQKWASTDGVTALTNALSIDPTDSSNKLPSPIAQMLAGYAAKLKKDYEVIDGMAPDDAARLAVEKVAEKYKEFYAMDHETLGSRKIVKRIPDNFLKNFWPDNITDGQVLGDDKLKKSLDLAASIHPELVIGQGGKLEPAKIKADSYWSEWMSKLTPAQASIIQSNQALASKLRLAVIKMKHNEDVINQGVVVEPGLGGGREMKRLTPDMIKELADENIKMNLFITKNIGG